MRMGYPSFNKGQTFLALVFFIGGLVAVAGLLIAFFAASSLDTGYGVAAAFSAESAATAGAEDGLLQLDRNSVFSNPSPGYTVSGTSSATATVTITQSSPSAGLATILSTATVSGHTKKINVVVSENATTGQINIVSWTEIQ